MINITISKHKICPRVELTTYAVPFQPIFKVMYPDCVNALANDAIFLSQYPRCLHIAKKRFYVLSPTIFVVVVVVGGGGDDDGVDSFIFVSDKKLSYI